MRQTLKGQYHAIFSKTLKIKKTLFGDSSQDIMTKIPLKDYQNAKKLSTEIKMGSNLKTSGRRFQFSLS